MIKVFISYRHGDANRAAERIYKYVSEIFDIDGETVIDRQTHVDSLPELVVKVHNSDVLLVIIGHEWLNTLQQRQNNPQGDDWVFKEIYEGIVQDGVLVIPVVIDDAEHPNPNLLPQQIAALGYKRSERIHMDDRFEADMQVLIDRIEKRHARHAGALRIYDDLPVQLLAKMISKAKSHVGILTMWTSQLSATSLREPIMRALKNGATVNIVLQHPENMATIARSRDLGEEDDFTSAMIRGNIKTLKSIYRGSRINDEERRRLHLYLSNALPSRVLFIADQSVLVGAHPAGMFSSAAPHTLVFGYKTGLYKSCLKQFDKLLQTQLVEKALLDA